MKTAVTALVILGLLAITDACGIWGQLFCDYCWDGKYTSGTDRGISGAQVFVNCTVMKDDALVYYWGTDTSTSSDGSFEASITGASNYFRKSSAEASFLYAFFKNSEYTQGLLSGVKIVGCSVTVTKAPACPTLSLNDGTFLTTGSQGNGWTSSNAFIAQYLNTDAADIYIGTGGSRAYSVAATPTVRGQGASKSCPASPPPPPGVKGDPHFTGADGSHFDFTGEPGNSYCLVTDSHVHVNAYFGGRYDRWGENSNKPLTWIRKIGIMWGEHTVTLAAREGGRWQYDEGYMSAITVDGKVVTLSEEGQSASFANGAIEISWLAASLRSSDDLVDVYLVRISDAIMLRLTLRPEVALLRTQEDGVVHFDVEFPKVDLSDKAHGVLGQTFRSQHRHRLNKQELVFSELLNTEVIPGDNAEGFLDGKAQDYVSSSLLVADCKVSEFKGTSLRSTGLARGVQVTSATGTGVSLSSGRKMLKRAIIN